MKVIRRNCLGLAGGSEIDGGDYAFLMELKAFLYCNTG